jgi:hypothetical protein
MAKPFCAKHPNTEPVCYCPMCRSEAGGKKSAAGMTKKQRVERAKKAAAARYKKEPR